MDIKFGKQIQNKLTSMFKWLFNKRDNWIYGTCNNTLARKHRKKGNVQMKLWKAGEQGYKEDYWHDFDSSWWQQFKPNN